MRHAPVVETRTNAYLDPEAFASRVRELAAEAFRVLKDSDSTYRQAVEVSRKLDDLRRQRRRENMPVRDIDRWLRNAAQQVREYRPAPCASQPVG